MSLRFSAKVGAVVDISRSHTSTSPERHGVRQHVAPQGTLGRSTKRARQLDLHRAISVEESRVAVGIAHELAVPTPPHPLTTHRAPTW